MIAVASEKGTRRVEGPGGDVPRPRLSGRVFATLARRVRHRQAVYDAAWEVYKGSARTPEAMEAVAIPLRHLVKSQDALRRFLQETGIDS